MKPVLWEILPESDEAAGLARTLGCHPLVAQLLWRRGLRAPDAIEAFLKPRLAELPDPRLLEGIDPAVDRIVAALRAGEKLCAYGDYDVDGVTSTTLLVSFLRACGANISYYVPHRVVEGYGLNAQAVERLAAEGVRLLVTLDCGITAHEEIDRAAQRGVDVVVVDHHTTPTVLPRAAAILNPWQPGCRYPTRHLCAVGVTFLLCAALRRRLRELGHFGPQRPEPNLKEALDLVALGTIADVVPLTGANRVLVRAGLEQLGRSRRPGIAALKRVAGLPEQGEIGAGQVGFRLGPRINAAGRLDDAGRAVELLLTDDPLRADRIARELDAANAERQQLEREILERAQAQADERADARGLVLSGESWHPGVVGIVAARIAERFHRPAIVIGIDPETGEGKGSGRSIEAFHLHAALEACAEHLVRFGGHKHAAGLTIRADALEPFRAAFEAHALQKLTPEDLKPRCRIDAEVTCAELSDAFCESLQALAPFGAGNPEPVFSICGTPANARVVGVSPQSAGHLKLSLRDAPLADAIGFGQGALASTLPGRIDLAFTLGFNEYRGERRLQLKLRDVRPGA